MKDKLILIKLKYVCTNTNKKSKEMLPPNEPTEQL